MIKGRIKIKKVEELLWISQVATSKTFWIQMFACVSGVTGLYKWSPLCSMILADYALVQWNLVGVYHLWNIV